MKQLKTIPFLLLFALLALWASGCATQNVNPPQARANTGYVDFHADPAGELYWQVERFDDRAQGFKKSFRNWSRRRAGFCDWPLRPVITDCGSPSSIASSRNRLEVEVEFRTEKSPRSASH
jgi:hypothetical protein